jgi:hypothetical protein
MDISHFKIDPGFKPCLGQTKDYKIGIHCISAKHATSRSKSKDWLNRNQESASERSYVSISGTLFQCAASTIKIKLSMLI